ncbi:MAG: hypothetical protein AB8E82_19105 [Aureispira sp.]
MNDDNVLDDSSFEEETIGELLVTVGSLSRWLFYVGIIIAILGAVCIFAGLVQVFQESGWEQFTTVVVFWAVGALWLNAARWQFKFIRWSKDLAAREIPYDQEHWVYLNYRLWQWLVFAIVGSITALSLSITLHFI